MEQGSARAHLLGTVVLVEEVVGDLLQVGEVGAQESRAEAREVRVLGVVDLNETVGGGERSDDQRLRSRRHAAASTPARTHPHGYCLALTGSPLITTSSSDPTIAKGIKALNSELS